MRGKMRGRGTDDADDIDDVDDVDSVDDDDVDYVNNVDDVDDFDDVGEIKEGTGGGGACGGGLYLICLGEGRAGSKGRNKGNIVVSCVYHFVRMGTKSPSRLK